MQLETIGISAVMTIFSIGLLIISIISYTKFKNPKLIFINIVFVFLLIKGIIYTLVAFNIDLPFLSDFIFSLYEGVIDIALLLLLFFATIKR